jgi:L-galactose dehydrogenase
MITDLDDLLTPLCRQKNIGLINASPLHMGILTSRGAPAWHPAPAAVKDAGMRAAELCRKRGSDISAMALRYCLNHPYVATTLVGMADPQHTLRNLEVLEMDIDPSLLAAIAEIVVPVKDITWPSGNPVNNDSNPAPVEARAGRS